ncbi:Acetyltransferase (GNAT) domain-containing protein [Filimonas lacunae]|uniref:Acetyltransferase (GNAT) domain-containing protein n=1 Tax=Filimonas lacunae TaxID=477680 RepID=A0A173MQZ2_9BACT|nr:GNAT family N-acetyltransferase [Filimonas lacunae]BAV09916.1 acetyltransferase [Filimonas lacunae]SIS80997.1 Acetyltransferase (GNAT) domain-containing protein [Filimonas lacunae]
MLWRVSPTTQVGFARLITDKATFAYLIDVFILPEYRGRGLSAWLMEVMHAHPELQTIRSWLLTTSTAHGLYEKWGYEVHPNPQKVMRKFNNQAYTKDK